MVHFLLALISGFSVLAASPDCELLLVFKAGAELEIATLDKMSELLNLSPVERDNVRRYGTFFTSALQARAQNLPIETLQAPHLTEQSRRLQQVLHVYIENWRDVGSSRVDLQACKLEYSIVSPK